MEQGKRIEYFIYTGIFWLIGFILYGVMMTANKEVLDIPLSTFQVFLLYGLEGGLLLGGLVSGILSFLPYGIYNFIAMKKNKIEKEA